MKHILAQLFAVTFLSVVCFGMAKQVQATEIQFNAPNMGIVTTANNGDVMQLDIKGKPTIYLYCVGSSHDTELDVLHYRSENGKVDIFIDHNLTDRETTVSAYIDNQKIYSAKGSDSQVRVF